MRSFLALRFATLALLSSPWLLTAAPAPPAGWKVKEDPYRATLRLTSPGNDAASGVEIELPDFGAHREDLADALLVDSSGKQLSLFPVWHATGKRALFIAGEMKPESDYFLYFGGRSPLTIRPQHPKQGLVLETRTLAPAPKISTQTEMLNIWNACTNVNGIGYVNTINTTGNPFGESTNFASHYTGLYLTTPGEQVTLYTLSSDASFVLADGRCIAEWPSTHAPRAIEKNIHKGTFTASSNCVKIDYYQAKVTDDIAFAALGVIKGGVCTPVPSESWVHPGKASVEKIEQAGGLPVPVSTITFDSYIGYGGSWLYDVVFEAPRNAPQEWIPEWRFADGTVIVGNRCERIIPLGAPCSVSLVYRKGGQTVSGTGLISFPDSLPAASVKKPADLHRYLDLLSAEKPEVLPAASLEPLLPFLNEYADNNLTGLFATAWLLKLPPPENPLWSDAVHSSIRRVAQDDPKKALAQLRAIDAGARRLHRKELALLELELLVFYLRDPSSPASAQRAASEFPGTQESQLAMIRLGDYLRLVDQPDKAMAQYASVQKAIPDETGGRKLPAMDRSYSITVNDLLANGMRREAEAKLREWELVHPLCKRDSDYLLLQARMLNSFGYWSQALAELDSFKKTHLESPLEITADFYRAECLDGLGKKDEARAIRSTIVKNYPRHELAEKCRTILSKP